MRVVAMSPSVAPQPQLVFEGLGIVDRLQWGSSVLRKVLFSEGTLTGRGRRVTYAKEASHTLRETRVSLVSCISKIDRFDAQVLWSRE